MKGCQLTSGGSRGPIAKADYEVPRLMLPVPRVLLVYLLEGKLPCDFAWPLLALIGQENHFLRSRSRRSCSSFRPVLSPFIRVGIPPGTPELRKVCVLLGHVRGGAGESAFVGRFQAFLKRRREETSPRGPGLACPVINAVTVGTGRMAALVFPVCPLFLVSRDAQLYTDRGLAASVLPTSPH